MKTKHFAYRLDNRWAALFLTLGVREKNGVTAGEAVAIGGLFLLVTR